MSEQNDAPPPSTAPRPATARHYFVDEAGDPVLFNRRKQIVVGTGGCSGHFVLGLTDIADPVGLGAAIKQLRRDLLSDPYFMDVPSMKAEAGKTASACHAKDDLPEVRRECSGC